MGQLSRETTVYPAEHGNRQPAVVGGRGDECWTEYGCSVTSTPGGGISVWVLLFVLNWTAKKT